MDGPWIDEVQAFGHQRQPIICQGFDFHSQLNPLFSFGRSQQTCKTAKTTITINYVALKSLINWRICILIYSRYNQNNARNAIFGRPLPVEMNWISYCIQLYVIGDVSKSFWPFFSDFCGRYFNGSNRSKMGKVTLKRQVWTAIKTPIITAKFWINSTKWKRYQSTCWKFFTNLWL